MQLVVPEVRGEAERVVESHEPGDFVRGEVPQPELPQDLGIFWAASVSHLPGSTVDVVEVPGLLEDGAGALGVPTNPRKSPLLRTSIQESIVMIGRPFEE